MSKDRRDEVQKYVQELIEQTRIYKEAKNKIKELKDNILQYTDDFDINDTSWNWYGNYVEVELKTTYNLTDIPVDAKVDDTILSEQKAEICLQPQMKLTKEGKKLFRLGDLDISKLMVPTQKKKIKVVLVEDCE